MVDAGTASGQIVTAAAAVATTSLAAWRVEQALIVTLVTSLGLGLWQPRLVRTVSIIGFATAVAIAVTHPTGTPVLGIGRHLLLDDPAASVRLVLCTGGLALVVAWRGSGATGAVPFLILSTLGLVLLAQATTTISVLVAIASAVLGGRLMLAAGGTPVAVSRRWHRTAVIGFALVTFAMVFWAGLGGSTDLTRAAATIASASGPPPVAVQLVLGLLLVGAWLALMAEPGRFARASDHAVPPPIVAWLTAAPVPALVVWWRHLLAPGSLAAPVPTAPGVMVAMGAVLVVVGFTAALARMPLDRRLAWAAPGQLGLVMMGYAASTGEATLAAATHVALIFVPLQLGAVLLADVAARSGRLRIPQAGVLTLMLLGLAAAPPLVGWQPRFALLDGLMREGALMAGCMVALAWVLGFAVYLQPLAALWREPDEAPLASPTATLIAGTGLLVAVVVWSLNTGRWLPVGF